MANLALTRGGAYRNDGLGLSRNLVYKGDLPQPPHRVAGEYQHGFFTGSGSLYPTYSIGQKEALETFEPGVGDFIGLFIIPAHYVIHDVASRVFPTRPALNGVTPKTNGNGFSFDVELRKYDSNTREEKSDKLQIGDELSGIEANKEFFGRTELVQNQTVGDTTITSTATYFVPSDEFVVIGIKINSLPSDDGVTIADFTGQIAVGAHVTDFEFVNEV